MEVKELLAYEEIVTELRGLVALCYMLMGQMERRTMQADAVEFLFQRLEEVTQRVEKELVATEA